MGSVISYEKCPQCGGVYVIDYNYRTGEEYQFCQRCGKLHNHAIVRDENEDFCYDENDELKLKDESCNGYGCMALASQGFTSVYHIDRPVDDEIKEEYLEIVSGEDVDKDECYLTIWDEEKSEIRALFGKLPESYDELYCDDNT